MADIPVQFQIESAIGSNILSTDLNSKASSATAINLVTTTLDMSAATYLSAAFELVLGSITPTAGGYITLCLWSSVDGTNFVDQTLDAVCFQQTRVLLTGASAKRCCFAFENLPPLVYKIGIINASGSSTASSGNTLAVRKWREKAVTP